MSYIGGGIKNKKEINIKDSIWIETSSEDELMIVNKNEFYMCPECGYGEKAGKNHIGEKYEKNHFNAKGYKCENNILNLIYIGHKFKTDVARFTIPILDVYACQGYEYALSFLYAFLEGVSEALEIERNDINGLIEFNEEKKSFDILVYDDVPGGAGHVKRFLDEKNILMCLQCAYNRVDKECCDEDTSCYKCLRNYYNQTYHPLLKRKYAKEYIEMLLKRF